MFIEDREIERTPHDKARDIGTTGILASGSGGTGRIVVAAVTDILSVERGWRIDRNDISTVYAAELRVNGPRADLKRLGPDTGEDEWAKTASRETGH